MNLSRDSAHASVNKESVSKTKESIADQKAKYDEQKEQERKRRFSILSGNIKPIQSSFHLQPEEHAYCEIKADRMADNQYLVSYTTGITEKQGVIGRSIAGSLIYGKAGAVIGGTTARGVTTSTTSQERKTRTETIDNGTLLFTNKNILFVGKEVVKIPYDEILSIEFNPISFNSTSMIVKYPTMVKNESYKVDMNTHIDLYYQGVMRTIGKDKSKVEEADINMSDYPAFISEQEKIAKKRIAKVKKYLIWTGIFTLMTIFLRGIILDFTIIVGFALISCGIAYPILHFSNNINKGEYEDLEVFSKRAFFWLIPILIFSFIIGVFTVGRTTNQTKNVKINSVVGK